MKTSPNGWVATMPLWWYLGGHVVFMSMCTLFPSYFSNLKTYFQQIGRKCVIWELCFDVDHIFICNIYTYVLYIFIIYIITYIYIYIYIYISLKSTQYDEKIEHTYLHIYSFETKTQRVLVTPLYCVSCVSTIFRRNTL